MGCMVIKRLAHGVGSRASICPHHLVEDVVECHQQIPFNGGLSSSGHDFECIVDVCIERVVYSTIYVACCVVVVLLALEGCRAFVCACMVQ